MKQRILYFLTHTPLHVGAGASVGAIDQPIQRERHTGFPIIPASSSKGSFADHWNDKLETQGEGDKAKQVRGKSDAAWLFGSDDANASFAGALLFGEARVLAFPIRSAKGSYAWITCPLMLQRAARDGVFGKESSANEKNEPLDQIYALSEPDDVKAIFQPNGKLALGANDSKQIVLEEYCLTHTGTYPDKLASALAKLVSDTAFDSIKERLVILSNGMMTHFVTTACEIAQHVCISDETGTAKGTGLFNQENVPADTLFYSVLRATPGRGEHFKDKKAEKALTEFETKVRTIQVFQFGGDASTGLGFCSVTITNQ